MSSIEEGFSSPTDTIFGCIYILHSYPVNLGPDWIAVEPLYTPKYGCEDILKV